MATIDAPAYRPLTPGQRRFLWCIWCWTTRNGRPPKFCDIMVMMGWSSPNAVATHAIPLTARGWILPAARGSAGTHLRLAGMRLRNLGGCVFAELLTDGHGRLTYEAERLERDVVRNGGQ